MQFSAKYKFESRACPGITVTLRRIGPKLRAQIELSTCDARARARAASHRMEQLEAQIQSALDAVPGFREAASRATGGVLPAEAIEAVPPEIWALAAQRGDASDLMVAIDKAEIQPAVLRAAIYSIEGFTDESGSSVEYSADDLCDSGPAELFDELTSEIAQNARLPREKTENL
jgi:hypothetical protein